MYITQLEDILKDFNDFKNKEKSVRSKFSWYVKLYTFWKFIHYIVYWDILLTREPVFLKPFWRILPFGLIIRKIRIEQYLFIRNW